MPKVTWKVRISGGQQPPVRAEVRSTLCPGLSGGKKMWADGQQRQCGSERKVQVGRHSGIFLWGLDSEA